MTHGQDDPHAEQSGAYLGQVQRSGRQPYATRPVGQAQRPSARPERPEGDAQGACRIAPWRPYRQVQQQADRGQHQHAQPDDRLQPTRRRDHDQAAQHSIDVWKNHALAPTLLPEGKERSEDSPTCAKPQDSQPQWTGTCQEGRNAIEEIQAQVWEHGRIQPGLRVRR